MIGAISRENVGVSVWKPFLEEYYSVHPWPAMWTQPPGVVTDGGMGFASQNDRRLHFGLGRTEWADRVVIHWPSGTQQVLTNPHSPPHWRAVGPERNVDAWYEAFGVKPGDKMYLVPEQRVKLW